MDGRGGSLRRKARWTKIEKASQARNKTNDKIKIPLDGRSGRKYWEGNAALRFPPEGKAWGDGKKRRNSERQGEREVPSAALAAWY